MDNSAYMSMILQEEGTVAYICGMETYDMLYLTDSGLALYGLASAREFHGRKCYELLQGLDSPCPFCTNCMIAGGKTYQRPRGSRTRNSWISCWDTTAGTDRGSAFQPPSPGCVQTEIPGPARRLMGRGRLLRKKPGADSSAPGFFDLLELFSRPPGPRRGEFKRLPPAKYGGYPIRKWYWGPSCSAGCRPDTRTCWPLTACPPDGREAAAPPS